MKTKTNQLASVVQMYVTSE